MTAKRLTGKRYLELKRILESERDKIASELRDKRRVILDAGTLGESVRIGDDAEKAFNGENDDLEFALADIKKETIDKYNDALLRLTSGDYGVCSQCGQEIAEKRLKALPFAIRCRDCQEAKENLERSQAHRNRRLSSFVVD